MKQKWVESVNLVKQRSEKHTLSELKIIFRLENCTWKFHHNSHGHLPHLTGLFQSGDLNYTLESLNIYNWFLDWIFFCNTGSYYTEENLLAGASSKVNAFKTRFLFMFNKNEKKCSLIY